MEAKDEAPIQRIKMDYAYKLIEQYISLIMRNNNNRSVLRELFLDDFYSAFVTRIPELYKRHASYINNIYQNMTAN